MGREKITGGETTYIRPGQLTKGSVIAGIYRGSFEDRFEKLNYRLEQADKSMKVVNGSGLLDNLMQRVNIGDSIEIVYTGKQALKTGKFAGKEAHGFEVFKMTDADATKTVVKEETKTAAVANKTDGFPF